MPNRLIRDGLLDSEAIATLPISARWLYVTILLSADDVGLFEATEFRLAKRADMPRNEVAAALPLLVSADLVRLYQGPGMRTLGFVPKFQQRIRIKRSKYPAPPPALYADDEDALSKFNELGEKMSDTRLTHVRTMRREPEPEPEPKEVNLLSTVIENSPSQAPLQVEQKAGKQERAKRLPGDWQLPKTWGEWAMNDLLIPADTIRIEADKFRDYWIAKSGKDATKTDWQATWRNWMRNVKERLPARPMAQQAAVAFRGVV